MYDIIASVEGTFRTVVVIGGPSGFFLMQEWKDGTYTRNAAGGLTLQTRHDFDYAAHGATFYASKAGAMRAAKRMAARQ